MYIISDIYYFLFGKGELFKSKLKSKLKSINDKLLNSTALNLEDFKEYGDFKPDAFNTVMRMIHKEKGDIIYVKKLEQLFENEFVNYVLCKVLLDDKAVNHGFSYSIDKNGKKTFYPYSTSLLNSKDNKAFLTNYAPPVNTLDEYKYSHFAKVDGIEKVLAALITLSQDFNNSNLLIKDDKIYKIDYGHSFIHREYFSYKYNALSELRDDITNVLICFKPGATYNESKISETVEFNMYKFTTALQEGIELLEYLNSNNRAVINELIYSIFHLQYEKGVFESKEEMLDKIKQYKTLHFPIAHPEKIKDLKTALSSLKKYKSLQDFLDDDEDSYDIERNDMRINQVTEKFINKLETKTLSELESEGLNIEALLDEYRKTAAEIKNEDVDIAIKSYELSECQRFDSVLLYRLMQESQYQDKYHDLYEELKNEYPIFYQDLTYDYSHH